MTSPHEEDDQRSSLGGREELERLRSENAMLRKDLDDCNKDLEDCKDQLLEALRKSNDIPESKIKAAFSAVFSGIDTWIDEIACEEGHEAAFRTQFRHKIGNGRDLESLGFHRRFYSSVDWRVRLSKLPYCFHIIVSLIVSKFLTDEVFRTVGPDEWSHLCPHGLSEPDVKNLVRLQDVMRSNLRRDDSEISRWRGQSISAMVQLDNAKERAKKACDDQVNKLQRRLGPWLEKPISKSLLDSLMESVIMRANNALDMMCCSNKTYLIGSLEVPPGPIIEQAESWHLKDLITWRRMSPNEDGALLQCLYPGLMRMGESGQDDLLLVKPTWMAYEHQEHLPPAVSRSPSPRKQSPTPQDRDSGERKAQRPRKPKPSSRRLDWFRSPFDKGSVKSPSRSSTRTSPAYSTEQPYPQLEHAGEHELRQGYPEGTIVADDYSQQASTSEQESYEVMKQEYRTRKSPTY